MKNILSGSLRVKNILACQEVLKWVWPSTNRNWLLFIQSQTLPPSIHHNWKEITDVVYRTTNRNHGGPTPHEKSHLSSRFTLIPQEISSQILSPNCYCKYHISIIDFHHKLKQRTRGRLIYSIIKEGKIPVSTKSSMCCPCMRLP